MKYMLLIYLDEQNPIDDVEREHCYVESGELAHELHASGQYIAANPLHPTSTATSVRVRDDRPLVTDGPFAETREQLGGYFLVDAPDLDAAITHRQADSGRAAGAPLKSGRSWRSAACRPDRFRGAVSRC